MALLDGGATHPLRTAAPNERDHLRPIQVELAHGSTTLFRKENCSTLLSLDEVEPIIPLNLLVQHGFQVQWAKDGCVIKHPRQGPISCWLRGGCPVMDRNPCIGGRATVEPKTETISSDSKGHSCALVFGRQPDSLEENPSFRICVAFPGYTAWLSL